MAARFPFVLARLSYVPTRFPYVPVLLGNHKGCPYKFIPLIENGVGLGSASTRQSWRESNCRLEALSSFDIEIASP